LRKFPHVEFKGLKGVIIFLVLAVLVVSYFFYLNNKTPSKEEETVKITAVQDVMSRNLNTNYPSTPKEVIKYFAEITKCFYNETMTDEELMSLADRMMFIYDDELTANKDYISYITDLKSDISIYKENGYRISSYSPSPSTDVEFFTQDGYEWARTWCMFNVKSSTDLKSIQNVFILRKDEKGHWRIYGWEEVDE